MKDLLLTIMAAFFGLGGFLIYLGLRWLYVDESWPLGIGAAMLAGLAIGFGLLARRAAKERPH
jgi:hypothetical protein